MTAGIQLGLCAAWVWAIEDTTISHGARSGAWDHPFILLDHSRRLRSLVCLRYLLWHTVSPSVLLRSVRVRHQCRQCRRAAPHGQCGPVCDASVPRLMESNFCLSRSAPCARVIHGSPKCGQEGCGRRSAMLNVTKTYCSAEVCPVAQCLSEARAPIQDEGEGGESCANPHMPGLCNPASRQVSPDFTKPKHPSAIARTAGAVSSKTVVPHRSSPVQWPFE